MGERFLTIPQLSQKLNISVKAGYQLVAKRRVPFVRLGRRVMIPEGRLDAALLDALVEPLDPPRPNGGRP